MKIKRLKIAITLLLLCCISSVYGQWTFDTNNNGFVTSTFDEENDPWPFQTNNPSSWLGTGGNPNGHIYHNITQTGLNDRLYAVQQNSANGLGDLTGKTAFVDFRREGGTFINGSGNPALAYWGIGDSQDPNTGNWWISKVANSVVLNDLTVDTWLSQSIEIIEINFMKWANSDNTTKTFNELIADYAFLGFTILSNQVTEDGTDPWNQYSQVGGIWRIVHYGVYSNNGSTVLRLDNFIIEDTLPVELSYFSATAMQQGVLCKWTTESETENLGFILERKTADTDWEEIASYKTDTGLEGRGSTSNATDYEYLDALVQANITFDYRLSDIDYNGVITNLATRRVTVEQVPLSSIVDKFTVLPAYPNPFNPSTIICYGIPDAVIASGAKQFPTNIAIYDITGKLVTTLFKGEQTSGWHSVEWNGTNQYGENVPAGMYISKVTLGDEVKTTKLMLLK